MKQEQQQQPQEQREEELGVRQEQLEEQREGAGEEGMAVEMEEEVPEPGRDQERAAKAATM